MSQSPQLGYNHNIPHRGRLYHVQTEDSGLKKAHIFTHSFYDGTIIASNKVTYDPNESVEDLDAYIVGLMQESHKAMIRRLRKGEFDAKIEQYIGPHPDADQAPTAEPAPEPTRQAPDERPERRAPPAPRDVPQVGPPLKPGSPSPAIDPSVSHPVFATAEVQKHVAAQATQSSAPPRRGPSRVKRRTLGGIGGAGVKPGTEQSEAVARRDVIIGKFASAHQAELDEEILALLREG
jgi:hypothetical protein